MKQTTYLATLPNQVRKLGKSHRIGAMATYGDARVSRDHSPRVDVADTINPRSFSMGVILVPGPARPCTSRPDLLYSPAIEVSWTSTKSTSVLAFSIKVHSE
jgi:hypothetical protein